MEAIVGSIFGAWAMVLVAATALAALAVELPLGIFKAFELVEMVAGKSTGSGRD